MSVDIKQWGMYTVFRRNFGICYEICWKFHINNIVSCLTVPTDFCLALADPVCLPEFVYSAYAHVNAPKKSHIYPFVPHYTPDDYDLFVHGEFSKL